MIIVIVNVIATPTLAKTAAAVKLTGTEKHIIYNFLALFHIIVYQNARV
jgi:hypothetical protein